MVLNTFFFNRCFDKSRLKGLISWSLMNSGEKTTIEIVEKLKDLGFAYATHAGISLSLDDLKIPPTKALLLSEAEFEIITSQKEYDSGNRTAVEQSQQMMDTWHKTSETLRHNVIQHFRATDILNPVYMMAFSGARGNISQVRQLVGMRGLMADPQGQIIAYPIRSNFREGLTLTEYVISCYGARKGLVDTALRTANSGYLTRRLVDVSHHVIVRETNCKTPRGIYLTDMKESNKILVSLQTRLRGRVLAEPIKLSNGKILRKDQQISPFLAGQIVEIHKKVLVRSPLTCAARYGICRRCYGWSLAYGHLVALGEAVGILAAQSIGEPGTQLTMRTFHTGGVFSGDVMTEVRAPYEGTIEFSSALQGTLIRTAHGRIAFLTKIEGEFFLKSKPTANSGILQNTKFVIPPATVLFVRQGETIASRQVIAEYSSVSAQKNQRIRSKHQLNSKIEGQIFFENVYTIQKVGKDGEIDPIRRAKKLGSICILSGRIYQSMVPSKFYPNTGDLLDKNSIMNQATLVSPSSGLVETNIVNKTKNLGNIVSLKKSVLSFALGNFKYQKFGYFLSILNTKNLSLKNNTSLNKKDNFFISNSLDQNLTTQELVKNSLYLHWFPEKSKTQNAGLLFADQNYINEKLTLGQLLWLPEDHSRAYGKIQEIAQEQFQYSTRIPEKSLKQQQSFNHLINSQGFLGAVCSPFTGFCRHSAAGNAYLPKLFFKQQVTGRKNSIATPKKTVLLSKIFKKSSKKLFFDNFQETESLASRKKDIPTFTYLTIQNQGLVLRGAKIFRNPGVYRTETMPKPSLASRTSKKTQISQFVWPLKFKVKGLFPVNGLNKKLQTSSKNVFIPSPFSYFKSKTFSHQLVSSTQHSLKSLNLNRKKSFSRYEGDFYLPKLDSGLESSFGFVKGKARSTSEFQIKPGWVYSSKTFQNAIQVNKCIIPTGHQILNDVVFDQMKVYIDCLPNKNTSFQDFPTLEFTRSFFKNPLNRWKISLCHRKQALKNRLTANSFNSSSWNKETSNYRNPLIFESQPIKFDRSRVKNNNRKVRSRVLILIRRVFEYPIIPNCTFKRKLSTHSQTFLNSNFSALAVNFLNCNRAHDFNKQKSTKLHASSAGIDYAIQTRFNFDYAKKSKFLGPENLYEIGIFLEIPLGALQEHQSTFGRMKVGLKKSFYKDDFLVENQKLNKTKKLLPSNSFQLYGKKTLLNLESLVFTGFLEFSLSRRLDTSNFIFEKSTVQTEKKSVTLSNTDILVYNQNATYQKTAVTLTSFFSPYEGELITTKTDWLGKQTSIVLTNLDRISFSTNEKSPSVYVGALVRYADKITKDLAITESGQVISVEKNKITIRRAQPILFSAKGIFHVHHDDLVEKNSPVLTLSYQRLQTGDIVQGIPKIEEFFEARHPKEGDALPENLHEKLQYLFKRYKRKLTSEEAARKSLEKIQQILVDGVLGVYQSQGVTISDKHIEIIVRQMTSKVRIVEGGRTRFLRGELLDLQWIETVNKGFDTIKAQYEPTLLGITKASLETQSFISAASFQETTKILSRAAFDRKTDYLRGLKENVILGHLIPVGTGFSLLFDPTKLQSSKKGQPTKQSKKLSASPMP